MTVPNSDTRKISLPNQRFAFPGRRPMASSRGPGSPFLQGSLIVFGSVQVAEGPQVGIGVAELIRSHDHRPDGLDKEEWAEAVGGEEGFNGGEDGRAAIEGGQGVVIAFDEWDR